MGTGKGKEMKVEGEQFLKNYQQHGDFVFAKGMKVKSTTDQETAGVLSGYFTVVQLAKEEPGRFHSILPPADREVVW